MLNGTVLPTQKYYYPLGNAPPVCLTQDLAPEEDADILCMECGDARNVLFTCFVDASRRIDVTCVDAEPGILARNVLLFSLLVDDKANANVERIFNIYYHWKLDRVSAELLEKQTSKLLAVSNSMEKWHGSAYGHFVRFCDARSLLLVRTYWRSFQLQNISRKNKEERLYQLERTIKEAKYLHNKMKSSYNVDYRSASLVGAQASKDLLAIANQWWNTGTTSSADRVTDLNPAFLFPSNEKHKLYYDLSPLSGFPVETAYIPITKKSVFHCEWRDRISSSYYLVNSAKSHFREWALAFRKAVKNKSVIRIFCGDALSFGCTLHNCRATGALSMNLYCENGSSSPLTLSDDYGKNKDAPVSFDVVDASNLASRLGLLNVIGVASSLLKYRPSSSFYAEMSVQRDENLSDQLTGFFGVDVHSISVLLGLVLPELFTNATHSPADAFASNKSSKMVDGIKITQIDARLRWKRLRGSVDVPFIHISAKLLAKLLIQIHNEMFTIEEEEEDDEDEYTDSESDEEYDDLISYLFGIKSRHKRHKHLSHKHVVTYSRASFAFFLNRVQATIVSDWNECFKYIHKKCLTSRSLADMMSVFVQDLLLNLRLFGADNGIFIKPAHSELRNAILAPILPINAIDDIPDMLCVTVRVPKRKLDNRDPEELGTSAIICSINGKEQDDTPWSSVFSTVHITFGTWHAPTTKNTNPFFEEDPAGFFGKSDMYASFMVPTWVLLKSKLAVPMVTCEMMSEEYDEWEEDSDEYAGFMHTKMTSRDVFVSRFMPRMSGLPTFARQNSIKPASATTSIHFTYGHLKISTVTRRVTIECPTVKAKLANKSLAVNGVVISPLVTVINVAQSKKIMFELPLPLSFSDPIIRIARTSSYAEVESRLFDPRHEDASTFMFPMVVADSSTIPMLWTCTRLNLDLMPTMSLNDKQVVLAVTAHAALMFSNREQVIDECGESDTRTSLKRGLVSIFKEYASGKANIFKLSKTNGEIQTIIAPSCMRLDLVNHTVVLDAAIISLTDEILSDQRVKSVLEKLAAQKIHQITVTAAENRAWKAILPTMVERCRLWKHNPNCEHLSENCASPICACGVGNFPNEDYLKSQTEKIPDLSYVISKYATRAAIAPVFAVPYVEECFRKSEVNNNTNGNNRYRKRNGLLAPKEKCAKCNEDIDEEDLKQCARCKEVSYCSKACKAAHYRKHKPHCKAT